MRQDVEVQAEELQTDRIHDAHDAAQLLLDMVEEGGTGGSGAAVPAALVSLGALAALQSLGAQLPPREHVQQLLHFCCIAREVVRLALPNIMLRAANQISISKSTISDEYFSSAVLLRSALMVYIQKTRLDFVEI